MTHEEISILIDRYMDGSTTAAEEQALRDWFARQGGDIPAAWQPLRAMFAFVSAERGETGTSAPAAETWSPAAEITAPAARVVPMRRTVLRRMVAAAVSAAAVAAVVLVLVTHRQEAPQGYVVIDGTVYTDRELAMEHAEQALLAVSDTGEDPFAALKMMRRE